MEVGGVKVEKRIGGGMEGYISFLSVPYN